MARTTFLILMGCVLTWTNMPRREKLRLLRSKRSILNLSQKTVSTEAWFIETMMAHIRTIGHGVEHRSSLLSIYSGRPSEKEWQSTILTVTIHRDPIGENAYQTKMKLRKSIAMSLHRTDGYYGLIHEHAKHGWSVGPCCRVRLCR